MIIVGGKGQKQPIGIAIGMDGFLTTAFDNGSLKGRGLKIRAKTHLGVQTYLHEYAAYCQSKRLGFAMMRPQSKC